MSLVVKIPEMFGLVARYDGKNIWRELEDGDEHQTSKTIHSLHYLHVKLITLNINLII